MNTPGLILSPNMSASFRFVIMDVNHTEGDRVIELTAPEALYDIAALLRDPERYVVEAVYSRATGEQAVAVATSRLHNIAGKYTGKDDPVMLVRTQMNFPATGEVLAPFALDTYVNLMDQYCPCYRADDYPPLDRRLSAAEFRAAVETARELGIRRLEGIRTPTFSP